MFQTATDEQYAQQIKEFARKAREWSVLHPEAAPAIQFNFPPRCLVVAVFAEAEEKGFVSINKDAKAMLQFMGAYETGAKAPTVFMIQMAFEVLEMIDKVESPSKE